MRPTTTVADSGAFVALYDATLSTPRMRQLYGTSGHFNVGYWEDGDVDLTAACDRLIDQAMVALPDDPRVIVDAGCGLGAGTRRVAARFPRALVVGANLSTWQLGEARRSGMRAAVTMDAARLAIGTGTADAVLAIESPQHFATRDAFLVDAHRVLKPRGILSMADMLFRNPDVIGPWMIPGENRIRTIAEYAEILAASGFDGIRIRDVTAVTWRPYCLAMQSVFENRRDILRGIEECVSHYVLVTARRS